MGRDSSNRLTNVQDYGPSLRFNEQLIVNYAYESVWIDRFRAPNDFTGRTLYQFDQGGNLLSVRRLDSQQRPVISATLQRNPEGALCGVEVRRYNEDGVIVEIQNYPPDAALLHEAFFLYEMFGQFK